MPEKNVGTYANKRRKKYFSGYSPLGSLIDNEMKKEFWLLQSFCKRIRCHTDSSALTFSHKENQVSSKFGGFTLSPRSRRQPSEGAREHRLWLDCTLPCYFYYCCSLWHNGKLRGTRNSRLIAQKEGFLSYSSLAVGELDGIIYSGARVHVDIDAGWGSWGRHAVAMEWAPVGAGRPKPTGLASVFEPNSRSATNWGGRLAFLTFNQSRPFTRSAHYIGGTAR